MPKRESSYLASWVCPLSFPYSHSPPLNGSTGSTEHNGREILSVLLNCDIFDDNCQNSTSPVQVEELPTHTSCVHSVTAACLSGIAFRGLPLWPMKTKIEGPIIFRLDDMFRMVVFATRRVMFVHLPGETEESLPARERDSLKRKAEGIIHLSSLFAISHIVLMLSPKTTADIEEIHRMRTIQARLTFCLALLGILCLLDRCSKMHGCHTLKRSSQ